MARLATDIMARIEWLKRLSDRHKKAVENQDVDELLRVAGEYASHEKTKAIARRIMIEVSKMRERQAAHG